MTEQPGGHRRVDRLLAADFLPSVPQLDDAALLAARDDAIQEEADLSYVRRLLQGRLDLLRFQMDRRSGGRADEPLTGHSIRDDDELVSALARVLTAHNPSWDGEPPLAATPPQTADPTPVGQGRREAEAVAADVRISNLSALDDAELVTAVARLRALEHQVSSTRRRVQAVADALTAEITRRVEAGRLPAGSLGAPAPP